MCGGEYSFNPESQKLVCSQCSAEAFIETDSAKPVKNIFTPTSEAVKSEGKTSQYLCSTCGVRHRKVDDIPLKRCPSCGMKTLSNVSDFTFTPDGIVPFKITREKASKLFTKWIRRRPFAPSDLKKLFKLKKMSGFYFPVWALDFDVYTSYQGVRVTTRKDREGRERTRRRPFSGTRSDSFNNLLVNANKSIKKRIMQNLGSFNIESINVYDPAYLFGFSSVEKDVSLHDSMREVKNDAINEIKNRIKKEPEEGEVQELSTDNRFSNERYCLCLLPIWATYYTYKNRHYECYINARTGETTGVAPKSGWKIFFLVSGLLGAAAFLGWLLGIF